jgi:hypothetical protein
VIQGRRARLGAGRRRPLGLGPLLVSGVIDSTGLAFGWTIVLLVVAERGGLDAGASMSAAMLVGIALSAPLSAWLSSRLSPRDLLRSLAVAEGACRLGVFVLLWLHAGTWSAALVVVAMNSLAWSAFAAMRTEVARAEVARAEEARAEEHSDSGRSLTWYAVAIASSEALAAGAAALLLDRTPSPAVLVLVTAAYVLSLIPQWWVGSHADPGRRSPSQPVRSRTARSWTARSWTARVWTARSWTASSRESSWTAWFPGVRSVLAPAGLGAAVFLLAGAPALLATVLAYQRYGSKGVVVSAVAFTICSLGATRMQAALAGRHPPALPLLLLGALLIGGWSLSGHGLIGLFIAQGCAGLAQCALEGELDSRIVSRLPDVQVTAGLAFASSSRALGGAVSVAALPVLLEHTSLPVVTRALAGVLLLAAAALAGIEVMHPVRHLPPSFAVGFAAGVVTAVVSGAAVRVRETAGVGRPSMPAWGRR